MTKSFKTTLSFFAVFLVVLLSPFYVNANEGETLGYVTDAAGILTEDEIAKLSEKAESISIENDCGVYIVTVYDHTEFGSNDVYDVATHIYTYYNLGFGEEQNGVMLLLSMKERDFALVRYGEGTRTIFDDDALYAIEEEFLYDFGNNYWYYGFDTFLSQTDSRFSTWWSFPLIISLLVGIVLAFFVGFGLRLQLKSVAKKHSASGYVPSEGGVELTVKEDDYTHSTTSRTKISSSSSSRSGGSRSRSGGGFSGRSGKF